MPAIVIKSKNALSDAVPRLEYVIYKQRVEADGGYIENEEKTKEAFAFLTENNISVDSVFVGASPEFGVKYTSSGTLEKLYSIGKPDGDLLASIRDKNLFSVIEINDNKALSFRGTSANNLHSAQGLKSVQSLAMCCLNKPPQLSSGENYGSATQHGMIGIYNRDILDSLGESLPPSKTIGNAGGSLLQGMYYEKVNLSDMPDSWKIRVNCDGRVKSFSYDNVWSGNMVFSDVLRTSITPPQEVYTNSGDKVITGDVPQHFEQSDYSVIVGSVLNGTALYSDVFEVWVLFDTDGATSKKLSLRSNSIEV